MRNDNTPPLARAGAIKVLTGMVEVRLFPTTCHVTVGVVDAGLLFQMMFVSPHELSVTKAAVWNTGSTKERVTRRRLAPMIVPGTEDKSNRRYVSRVVLPLPSLTDSVVFDPKFVTAAAPFCTCASASASSALV